MTLAKIFGLVLCGIIGIDLINGIIFVIRKHKMSHIKPHMIFDTIVTVLGIICLDGILLSLIFNW